MAAPVAKLFIALGKKVFIDILSEPEKVLKYLFLFIFLPLIILILIFSIPVILILSIPSLLFSGAETGEIPIDQLELIAIYQDAPIQLHEEALKWQRETIEKYSWADSIVTRFKFDLTWQDIMAIDSVILEQDFTNADETNIYEIGKKFIEKESYTETYTVTKVDSEGRVRIVTKTRAYIIVNTISINEVINNKLNFNEFDTELALNIHNTILDMEVESNLNIYDDIDIKNLQEYPPGSANLPFFHQADVRWGGQSYGNSTIAAGGCGPTTLAMVVSGLTNNNVTPLEVANWSVANGHRAEGAGSYWSLMTAGGRHYGLNVETVSRRNPDKIITALSNGYPVIASMGRGDFTNGGHFIVLRGLTDDGKILVHDSASVNRSNTKWDIATIINQSSTNGGVNGSPFWIFKP